MRTIIYTLLFVIVAAVYAWVNYTVQSPIEINGGKGWDGVHYERMCASYKSGEQTQIAMPFGKRIATPWLASHFDCDSAKAFQIINVTAGLLCAVICFWTMLQLARPITAVFLAAPLVFYIFGPLRFSFFYPFYVDPLAMLFYALAGLSLIRNSPWSAVLALMFSSTVRESGIYFAMAIAPVYYLHGALNRRQALVMTAFCVTSFLAISALHFDGPGRSQFIVALTNAVRLCLAPEKLVKLFAGLAMTAGPLLAIWLKGKSAGGHPAGPKSVVFAVWIVLAAAMAAFGGSDTTRLLYISYPLYVLYFTSYAHNCPATCLLFVSFSGLVTNRILSLIPQANVLSPRDETQGYFAFYPDYAHVSAAVTILVFWAMVIFLTKNVPWRRIEAAITAPFSWQKSVD
jgi:hypothetical protein